MSEAYCHDLFLERRLVLSWLRWSEYIPMTNCLDFLNGEGINLDAFTERTARTEKSNQEWFDILWKRLKRYYNSGLRSRPRSFGAMRRGKRRRHDFSGSVRSDWPYTEHCNLWGQSWNAKLSELHHNAACPYTYGGNGIE